MSTAENKMRKRISTLRIPPMTKKRFMFVTRRNRNWLAALWRIKTRQGLAIMAPMKVPKPMTRTQTIEIHELGVGGWGESKKTTTRTRMAPTREMMQNMGEAKRIILVWRYKMMKIMKTIKVTMQMPERVCIAIKELEGKSIRVMGIVGVPMN